MKRRILSMILFVAGLLFLVNSGLSITGAMTGVSNIGSLVSFVIGSLLILGSVALFVGEKSELERKISEFHWRKYSINKHSIESDIEQEYIDETERGIQNKRGTYKEQFHEGHAAMGARVIDVEGHIAKKGKYKGGLIHFGHPVNGRYLWVVDEDCNFIVAKRQTMLHEMPQMREDKIDYHHRLHKLPHATLARGRKIYGSGEVLIEAGKITRFNTASGHYVKIDDIVSFNKQGEEVFRCFIKVVGWKETEGGAKYLVKKK